MGNIPADRIRALLIARWMTSPVQREGGKKKRVPDDIELLITLWLARRICQVELSCLLSNT